MLERLEERPHGFERHDDTIKLWIELSGESEVVWRGMTRTLARALLVFNSGKRNGREIAYRQTIVAMLRSSRCETSDIAELLDVDEKTVQRDDRVLRDLAEARHGQSRSDLVSGACG